MSYILEALRRAEADRARERGQMPGLHTPPLPGREAAPAAGQRRWLPWAGGGLLLLLTGIGAGSWWASGPQEALPPARALPQPQPRPAMPAPSTANAAAPTAPTAPVATQAVVAAPLPPPAASVSPTLPPAPLPDAVAARASVPAPAPAPAAEARIPQLSELPESTRRELPQLAISGSVYSDDPASRFLIANGEVLREGGKLGADLVLEQIRPHELVLRFKGQRYRLPV